MSIEKKIFLIIILSCVIAQAQDIPQFEIADNIVLGLIPVLVDRWGCSAADIDRNGWPDIFDNKWRGHLESQIYMNTDGFFTDIYANSPELRAVEIDGNATRTPVLVDFDNDGDRDLMIGFDKSHHFFRNDNGVFVDISGQLGLINQVPGFVSTYTYDMSAWIDIDSDGDLDGLVYQTNNPNFLFYRNDGNVFTNIAADVGLANVLPLGSDGDWGGYAGRLQWVDFDNDGDPDLNAGYLLFRNENGHFTEISHTVGFLPLQNLWFTDWFDFDVDGDLDFIGQRHDHLELWRNDNGTFVDVTQDVGLDLYNKPNQACLNVGDLDNDGDLDLFVQINDWTGDDIEGLLLNDEYESVRSFVDVAQFAGMLKQGDRKGSVILDYDMDGLLDVFIPSVQYGSVVYHNLGLEAQNNWIGFDLWGTKSNKDALGSWVTLYAGGKKQVRYTKAATTFKVQDNPFVNFGIGLAISVDSVVIRWPMGDVQVLTGLAINQYHKIVELAGTGVAEDKTQNDVHVKSYRLAQNYPNPFNPETRIDYALPTNAKVLLEIYNLSGQKVATLVNGNQSAGCFSVNWTGVDDTNNLLPSGIYIYALHTNDVMLTKKMLFIR